MKPKFQIPEFLYHGTSETAARAAISDGLKPRSAINRKGNWEHTIDSHPDCVYLTDIYSPYFAATSSYLDDKWAMTEIDVAKLKKSLFRPDEDCMEQGTRNMKNRFDGGKLTMTERTRYFRDHQDEYKSKWKLTLEILGTCAYKGVIPPSAISRVAIYDPKNKPNGVITISTLDAMIVVGNHRFCYHRYKNLTRRMFGEKLTVAEFYGNDFRELIMPPDAVEQMKAVLEGAHGGRELIELHKKALTFEI